MKENYERRLLVSAQQTQPDPADAAATTERRDRLLRVLKTLHRRERETIELRYGIHGGSPRSPEEVGRILKLTRERVRQIEKAAIRKLRHPVRIAYLTGARQ